MKKLDENSIEFVIEVAEISTDFEMSNTELKKKYIIKNINLINSIMELVIGYRGSFGTGYPFYALGENFEGNLPIISEQLRYNNELIENAKTSGYSNWICADCLSKNYREMADLKVKCLPCGKIIDSLKPRKVINRLPDIDMWMVCDDEMLDKAKIALSILFEKYNISSSDIDPIKTIKEMSEISDSIKNGIMPDKYLPIDIHIISYSQLLSLIKQVPGVIKQSLETNRPPYLPIHPISLRKSWQYDINPYNFINDFLINFTDFNFDSNLKSILENARIETGLILTEENLVSTLDMVLSESTARRFETQELVKQYKRRVKRWKES